MKNGNRIIAGSSTRLVALAAIMTAVVTAATFSLRIPIPATQGYFNVGDSMIFVSALLFGPLIGAFSGGVGSMLSDILATAPWYAPGTLVIKGLEGFVIGFLFQRIRSDKSKKSGREKYLATGLMLAFLAVVVLMGLYLGTSQDPIIWMVVSVVPTLPVIGIVYHYRHDTRAIVCTLLMLLGGAIMVTGYYLYEFFALGYGIGAIVEVPLNIVQALASVMIALPVYLGVSRAISV
ncbi:MAG: ECF transporter S component [Candidatus Atabeyarchaeum deiterrae]